MCSCFEDLISFFGMLIKNIRIIIVVMKKSMCNVTKKIIEELTTYESQFKDRQ